MLEEFSQARIGGVENWSHCDTVLLRRHADVLVQKVLVSFAEQENEDQGFTLSDGKQESIKTQKNSNPSQVIKRRSP